MPRYRIIDHRVIDISRIVYPGSIENVEQKRIQRMTEIQCYHTYTHNADITNVLLNRYIKKDVAFYYIFLKLELRISVKMKFIYFQ